LNASPFFLQKQESIFAEIAASHSGQLIAGVTGVKKTHTQSFARPGSCARELPVSRNTS
jgi:hypothetical protein